MFNEIVSVFTSGDIAKMLTFSLGFIIIVGFSVFLIIVAKKFGIMFNIKGPSGENLFKHQEELHQQHSQPQSQPSPKPMPNPEINAVLTAEQRQSLAQNQLMPLDKKLKQEYENLNENLHLETALSEVDFTSEKAWDKIQQMKLNTTIDKKEFLIEELTKKNENLRKKIMELNRELTRYKLKEDPELVILKSSREDFRTSFHEEFRSICLYERIIDKLNKENFKQYLDEIIYRVLEQMGKNLILLYQTKYWKDEYAFIDYMKQQHGQDISDEFSVGLKQMKLIEVGSKKTLKERRKEIDKRIISVSNGLGREVWDKLYNKTKKGFKPTLIKEAAISFDNFKNKVWNPKLFHSLIYSVGVDMITTYEQIRSESFDKEMVIAIQLFELLFSRIEADMKDKVLQNFIAKNGNEDLLGESAPKKKTFDSNSVSNLFGLDE